MAKLITALYVIVLLVLCTGFLQILQQKIEGFVDDYKIVAMNAFPCKPPGIDMTNKSGCYYTELDGCAVFPSRQEVTTCPSTSAALQDALKTPSVLAQNEDVFDYVYDALKEVSSKTSENCEKSPPCSFDFFKKLALMTDGELNAYNARIQKSPCSMGGICMLPENVAAYISYSQNKAAQNKMNCSEAQKAYGQANNTTSKTIISRTFPDCNLAAQ